jgi:hypothetical protein
VGLATKFLSVVVNKASSALVENHVSSKIITIHCGTYTSAISPSDNNVAEDIHGKFEEKDFEDGLVRIRFELMRFIIPVALKH